MSAIEHRRNLTALALLLVLTACEGPADPPGGSGQASLTVTANLSATAAVTVVVEVTAPDITTPLVFNIPVVNGLASGTVTISAGSNRTITMRAYDANGSETHRGAVTVNIPPGTSPTIALVLMPLSGDVPIDATLGSITLTVTPSAPTIGIGLTVTLAATITDPNGTPMVGSPSWATSNPGVASVTTGGVVTGVAAGQTTVVATFQGAAGSATVTVTGP